MKSPHKATLASAAMLAVAGMAFAIPALDSASASSPTQATDARTDPRSEPGSDPRSSPTSVPTSAPAANSMGFIGCSMAENAAQGYVAVGGTRMWGPYGTSGMVVQSWTDTNSRSWQLFDQQAGEYGKPTAVWVQICIFSTNGATYDEVKQLIANAPVDVRGSDSLARRDWRLKRPQDGTVRRIDRTNAIPVAGRCNLELAVPVKVDQGMLRGSDLADVPPIG